MFKNKYFVLLFIAIALIVGYIAGRTLPRTLPLDDRLPIYHGCNQIARWHADYLMREYGIDFNTSPENPKAQINERATELNGRLLEICNIDPR